MAFEERWYQSGAADAVQDFIVMNSGLGNEDKHPIVVLPTAAGKTIVLCGIIDRFLSWEPSAEVLVLSHVQEILEQDHDALVEHFGEEIIGLWSSGLGTKEKNKITVAGIQSVFRKPERFAKTRLVIIDECHLISHKDQGMYRKFLGELNSIYCGLTATPFRLGHGMIHIGEDRLFTDIVYDMSSRDNFNRLVEEGYLARLITKKTLLGMNADEIKIRGGDFATDDLSRAFDRDVITQAAIEETIKFGKNYKKWLLFAIDIAHAENINKKLNELGVASVCVHSKMEGNRREVIEDYRRNKYRAIVTVDALTTGFNVRNIDLIAMLRPTKSPVIHVQTIGRGLRIADGKDHCLVLDFAGNTARIGPINDLQIRQKGQKKGGGEPILKLCPECETYHHGSVRNCDVCGHEFVFQEKLQLTAAEEDVVVGHPRELSQWMKVDGVLYSIYQKTGRPSSVLVSYKCGLVTIKEYINYDHKGYPRHLAKHWIKIHLPVGVDMPQNVKELYKICEQLKKPQRIFVKINGRYPEVTDFEW